MFPFYFFYFANIYKMIFTRFLYVSEYKETYLHDMIALSIYLMLHFPFLYSNTY